MPDQPDFEPEFFECPRCGRQEEVRWYVQHPQGVFAGEPSPLAPWCSRHPNVRCVPLAEGAERSQRCGLCDGTRTILRLAGDGQPDGFRYPCPACAAAYTTP